MLRIALKVLLVIEVCALLAESITKPLPRCRAYKVQPYERGVPSCDTPSGRISIKDFPHVAILGYRDADEEQYRWACQGSLLNSRYVLAPAGCLWPSREPKKVRLGAIKTNPVIDSKHDYDIEKMIPHPLFNPWRYYNDIGLIKLSRQVEFSDNVRPICLPESDISTSIGYQVYYESTQLTQDTHEMLLTKYKVALPTNEDCSALDPSLVKIFTLDNPDNLFCITKISNVPENYTSRGKYGSPIYIDKQVPFINTYNQIQFACTHVLFGIDFADSDDEPTAANFPDLGVQVYPFLDWIDNIIWAD